MRASRLLSDEALKVLARDPLGDSAARHIMALRAEVSQLRTELELEQKRARDQALEIARINKALANMRKQVQ